MPAGQLDTIAGPFALLWLGVNLPGEVRGVLNGCARLGRVVTDVAGEEADGVGDVRMEVVWLNVRIREGDWVRMEEEEERRRQRVQIIVVVAGGGLGGMKEEMLWFGWG